MKSNQEKIDENLAEVLLFLKQKENEVIQLTKKEIDLSNRITELLKI